MGAQQEGAAETRPPHNSYSTLQETLGDGSWLTAGQVSMLVNASQIGPHRPARRHLGLFNAEAEWVDVLGDLRAMGQPTWQLQYDWQLPSVLLSTMFTPEREAVRWFMTVWIDQQKEKKIDAWTA